MFTLGARIKRPSVLEQTVSQLFEHAATHLMPPCMNFIQCSPHTLSMKGENCQWEVVSFVGNIRFCQICIEKLTSWLSGFGVVHF